MKAEQAWFFLSADPFLSKWVKLESKARLPISKPLSPLFVDDSMSSWGSGSSVLDLIFPQPETVTEIRFRNWYTARMSLLVRFDDSAQAPPKKEHLAWAAAAVT